MNEVSETEMRYYLADEIVYRRAEPGDHFEIYAGSWVPARGERAPSEQDYEQLRGISEAEALERINEV